MPDDTTSSTSTTGTTGTAADTAVQTDTTQGDPAELGDAGKKALDAERSARTKAEREAKTLKARLDELENASLSELEKAKKEAAEATSRVPSLEAENMRLRVAIAKSLPADLVDRLRGNTEEELTADADALLVLVGQQQTTRTPSFDGGVRRTADGKSDMNSLIRRAAGVTPR